jgi:hypothetical protein
MGRISSRAQLKNCSSRFLLYTGYEKINLVLQKKVMMIKTQQPRDSHTVYKTGICMKMDR